MEDTGTFRVGVNLTILKGTSVAEAGIYVQLTLKYEGVGIKQDLRPW